jgi:ferrous iron transport protein A
MRPHVSLQNPLFLRLFDGMMIANMKKEGDLKGMQVTKMEEVSSRRKMIPLNVSLPGEWLRICSVPGGLIFTQFIRFGISEGERMMCIERLPGGTVVVQKNRQQIAIGHTLAKQIFVVVIEAQEE